MIFMNIVAVVLVCFFFFVFRHEKEQEILISKKVEKIFVIVFFFLFSFLLFFHLGSTPYGLHVDEAGMAYDAISLAKYGVDRFLYHNPVYFINFGGGQNALYTYLAAIVVKLFGFSIFNIRIPAVFLSLLSFLFFSRLLRQEKGVCASLISLFLFCVLPFSIMHSRWSLESYLFFPMLIFSTYFLWQAWNKKKNLFFLLAGISFGITLYTYAISYLILPFFLGILLLYGLFTKQITWKQLFLLGVPLFFLALPLMLMLAVQNGFLSEIKTSLFSIPKLWFYRGGEFSLKHILENFNIFCVLFGGDTLVYNANPYFGTFYYFSIPFVLYGGFLSFSHLIKDFKTKKLSLDSYFSLLFLSIFFCVLLLDGPNVNRVNAIYVPLLYFLVLGLLKLFSMKKSLLITVGTMYIFFFSLFATYYYQIYPNTVQDTSFFVSFSQFKEAILFANEKSEEEIYVVDHWVNQPYIYTLLASDIDPYSFNKDKVIGGGTITSFDRYRFTVEQVEKDKVYVLLKSNEIENDLEQMGYRREDFGNIKVYY